ncbi:MULTISPECIES: OsmC family protein [Exiguobacterium]|jgi:putative redox protein|uniref:Peroxiredoxin n=1 Tax=Exiguobacterium chiriqhucha RW-2 TaxID=1345023 RepID=U1LVS5_9BACL|nr:MULTISPECIES: OsmC family protein [Exiguobacterium]ERG66714.1 peroxiredoxin [Exiguobacterium chiriqhucha RW-2]KAB2864627.1 MAG: OsmC family protein [Exiguobacterium chiriqhucha]TCI74108.1 OsmC family peroxiredoxin [Exiguobacterium sp. IPCI3]TCI83264.1 OsmC family peroxiredoxin [Exiguobacterium sp. IPCH1]TCI84318.1 OsmC family peroxiredoxin [Exiguobacterium sp. IPBC4]
MHLQVNWKQGMAFQTTTPSGHDVTLDAGEDVGGLNTGPRPTEMLLQATAACTGIDIVSILHKMRLPLERFEMKIDGVRATEHPKKFTAIHILYVLDGDMPEERVRRAIELSVDRYCSVSHSLNATMTYSYQLNGGEVVPFT